MNAIEISLFTGVGGFSMAAEWAGWETYATCELEPNLRRTLEYYYPDAVHHDNVDTFTYESINARLSSKFGPDWRRGRKLVVTGGFPCQPFSVAGEMLGTEDPRHKWPEMLRVIREFKPEWVVGENVYGLITWSKGLVFEQIQVDLENEGYEVWPVILPAAGVGAPHRRDRVWFIAHSKSNQNNGRGQGRFLTESSGVNVEGSTTHTSSDRRQRDGQGSEIEDWESGSRSYRFLERGPEGLCALRVASHTTKQRLPISGLAGKSEFQEKNREGLDYRPEFICDAPNAYSVRQPREEYREIKPGFASEKSPSNYWENFPTQQPICDGNDGFPYDVLRSQILRDTGGTLSEKEVDKIISEAFSEWRKEGVKAMGNAIVPQVVLQIFETINEIERIGVDNLEGLDIFALKNT